MKDILSGPVGIVKISCMVEGKLQWQMEGRNLVTDAWRDVMGELLIQAALMPGARPVSDLVIQTMQMGTSNATVSRSQTSLQSTPPVVKTLNSSMVSWPSVGEFVFNATMTDAEGNGNTFQEVGLFTADGTMLSRQVHSPFLKDNTQTIFYTYTYIFG